MAPDHRDLLGSRKTHRGQAYPGQFDVMLSLIYFFVVDSLQLMSMATATNSGLPENRMCRGASISTNSFLFGSFLRACVKRKSNWSLRWMAIKDQGGVSLIRMPVSGSDRFDEGLSITEPDVKKGFSKVFSLQLASYSNTSCSKT